MLKAVAKSRVCHQPVYAAAVYRGKPGSYERVRYAASGYAYTVWVLAAAATTATAILAVEPHSQSLSPLPVLA